VMIAAGTESMSLIPMGGNKMAVNPQVFTSDENVGIAYGMGITAEKVAKRWNVSREAQDQFAAQSHERALRGIAAGEFKDEITAYCVTESVADLEADEVRTKSKLAENDEGPRPGSTPDVLAKLKPAFAQNGTVTAGNSSQMSDGAAAVILVSGAAAARFNLKPIGRFVSYAVAGVPPEIMGIGPVEAIPKVLKQVGLTQDDLDWIELNEAFAAQSLAVIGELQLNPAKVNPLGGAIALGHPLGATGAIRTATLLHGLKRRKQKYGMVTMCVGTGMGAAGVFEAVG
jgi:acetyl-CoA acyltransferase